MADLEAEKECVESREDPNEGEDTLWGDHI